MDTRVRCLFIRFLVQPRDRCLFRNADISLVESGLCHSFLWSRERLLQSRDIGRRKHCRGSSSAPIRVFSSTGVWLVVWMDLRVPSAVSSFSFTHVGCDISHHWILRCPSIGRRDQRRQWSAAELLSGAAPCWALLLFPKVVNSLQLFDEEYEIVSAVIES